ncbi:MAG: transporter ATP-binding protein, partial [Chromatiaceae bacterium]|nr:transporter ATP-binding protein [Chromatiaceae bacterium]
KTLAPLRARLQTLETRLEQLEARHRELTDTLAAPELYEPGAKPRLLTLLEQQRQTQTELARIESEWLTLSEELEHRQAELA